MPKSIAESHSVDIAEYPYDPQPSLLPFDLERPAKPLANLALRRRGWILAVALTVVFCLVDLAIVPLMELVTGPNDFRILPIFVLIGAMFAQAALLSVLFVFGAGRFWRRLTICISATIVAWGIWEAGCIVAQLHGWSSDDFAETIQFTGLALPLAAIAVQWPLWFFRLYLKWRLTDKAECEAAAPPLSIRDYLLGTTLAALAVTFARLAPAENSSMQDYWSGWAIFFGFAGAASLVVVIPAMLLMFRLADWRIAYCLIVMDGFAAGVIALSIIAATDKSFRDQLLAGKQIWDALGLVTIFVGLGLFLGVGLKALRDMGFELIFTTTAKS